ncbi:AAA family ATPase [Mycolicibacterium sp. 22603]|uniref:AAA family ATPase n=1 Tax=Mycolicibacterium sp. 22603 TaxID=3453950 RepID=UPI003F834804
MAFITAFSVTGLAGRDTPVSFELDRELNIFWGLNGCGKTSLLKILHAALNNDALILEKVTFTSARVEFYSEALQSYYARSIDNGVNLSESESDDKQAVLSFWSEGESEIFYERVRKAEWKTVRLTRSGKRSHDASLNRIPNRMKHGYLDISRLVNSPADKRNATNRVIGDDFFDMMFARQVQMRWQAYQASALDKIQSIQQRGIGKILGLLFGDVPKSGKKTADAPPVDEAFDLVRKFMADQSLPLNFSEDSFASQYRQDAKLRQIVGQIEAVFQDRELALRPQREFKSVIERLYSGRKRLDLGGTDGISVFVGDEGRSEKIPLEKLSAGERQLLRILLEIMIADSSAVIIDEPELSMHVDWQRELVHAMRVVNPHCQMILATHSPEVMALVPSENIFEL